MAGSVFGVETELEEEKGGSEETSYGGGGTPSLRTGGLVVLCPGKEPSKDGENMPPIALVHEPGVFPVPGPSFKGLVTLGGGGNHADALPPLYAGSG